MDKGILDSFLAPLGRQIVDPNMAVSGMITGKTQAQLEEEERQRQLMLMQKARETSAPEAAASVPHQASSWNPFVWMFGDPAQR